MTILICKFIYQFELSYCLITQNGRFWEFLLLIKQVISKTGEQINIPGIKDKQLPDNSEELFVLVNLAPIGQTIESELGS